jgi:hypothetical protein
VLEVDGAEFGFSTVYFDFWPGEREGTCGQIQIQTDTNTKKIQIQR